MLCILVHHFSIIAISEEQYIIYKYETETHFLEKYESECTFWTHFSPPWPELAGMQASKQAWGLWLLFFFQVHTKVAAMHKKIRSCVHFGKFPVQKSSVVYSSAKLHLVIELYVCTM